MYKISVPVVCSTAARFGLERTLEQVRRFDAERVFLVLSYYEKGTEQRNRSINELKEACAFFKAHGYEVGSWVLAFTFGHDVPFQHLIGYGGEQYKTIACPKAPEFLDTYSDFVSDMAGCGVDMIMFDDDLRYGFLGAGTACLCPLHIRAINGITGETLDREQIRRHILTGGRNKYRDAYIKANGDALKEYAKRMRAAVDAVDPAIRLGFCACMTSWDMDGVTADELARILAGNTKPFVRLIGAPYWAVNKNWGHELQDTVEMERMESVWTKADDIEVFAEGDPFPRPRFNCPASYLEGFDTAIRASGCTDGILKYGVDYTMSPEAETGYAKMHERNRAAYVWIDENFKGEPCGIRIYMTMEKFADVSSPTKVNEDYDPEKLIFPFASRSLSYCSVPTTYTGKGVCGACFGENARKLPETATENGLIVDAAAAEILTERGIDCGLRSVGEPFSAYCEYFTDGERINVRDPRVYDIELDPKAEIQSYTVRNGKKIPVSAYYKNGKGQKFLILNVNQEKSASQDIVRHYRRSRQYAEAAERLGGKKLPAYVYGCPSLYIQCRKDESKGTLTVGLWNFFADPVIEPVAELDGEYRDFRFFNCGGKPDKNTVKLTDIPPYSFAAFTAEI